MQMGRGEELGSGVLNVNKYLPFYARGGKARFIEGDPFTTIIPLSKVAGNEESRSESSVKSSVKDSEKTTQKTTQRTTQKKVSTSRKILDIVRSLP